jgi:Ribosomal prokaryotic L21 protein
MYAIFENGSRQYRVHEGDRLTIDRQHGDRINVVPIHLWRAYGWPRAAGPPSCSPGGCQLGFKSHQIG